MKGKKKPSFDEFMKKTGYYEGKPSPMGFPTDPPPEMVNGYHPDLVTPEGQEKQSQRFNKMDPQTAQMAMRAPTGNPKIDAKVKKAARMPK
tara:strand:- start:18 stop:290 length:273 start_codon:yes stop_codon:yes gene_type:complete